MKLTELKKLIDTAEIHQDVAVDTGDDSKNKPVIGDLLDNFQLHITSDKYNIDTILGVGAKTEDEARKKALDHIANTDPAIRGFNLDTDKKKAA